jgi:hypothetical protein
MMRDEGHARWRDLVDRHDGRLGSRQLAAVSSHLAHGCASCVHDCAEIELLVEAIAAGPLDTPPASLDRTVLRLFRETNVRLTEDLLIGVLLYDQPGEFVAAMRGTSGETRRLLWRVGDYEVDASLVARASGTDLLAQIVPGGDDPDAEVTGVVAARSERGVRTSAPVQRDGRFTFRGLVPGLYTLEGRVDAVRFVLPPIHIE